MDINVSVNVVYAVLILVLVWVASFTVIAFYISRRRTWTIMMALVLSTLLVISALLISRSPWVAEIVKVILRWLQRWGLVFLVASIVWLVIHMMRLENGRLSVVYDAMMLVPLRRRLRLGATKQEVTE